MMGHAFMSRFPEQDVPTDRRTNQIVSVTCFDELGISAPMYLDLKCD